MTCFITAIRRLLCRHTFITNRLQPLVRGTTYTCTKCGKMEHLE